MGEDRSQIDEARLLTQAELRMRHEPIQGQKEDGHVRQAFEISEFERQGARKLQIDRLALGIGTGGSLGDVVEKQRLGNEDSVCFVDMNNDPEFRPNALVTRWIDLRLPWTTGAAEVEFSTE